MNEKTIKSLLNEVGIKISQKGYRYYITAIQYVLETDTDVMGKIYEYVAKKHNSTIIRVEGALRHSWENREDIKEYFKNEGISYKLNNTVVLMFLTDKVNELVQRSNQN